MVIRKGTPADFSGASKLIESFAAESMQYYGFKLDKNIVYRMMLSGVDNSLVAEEKEIAGVIAGLNTTEFLDGSMVCQEIIWYMLPEYRKYGVKLFREFEILLKAKGVSKLIMGHLGNTKSEKLEKFYLKHNYKLFEQQFIKEL